MVKWVANLCNWFNGKEGDMGNGGGGGENGGGKYKSGWYGNSYNWFNRRGGWGGRTKYRSLGWSKKVGSLANS